MARNRKNQSAGLPVGPALKAALICGFIVVCCVGYVWQKKQIAELSQQISNDEKRLKLTRLNNEKLESQLASLLLPGALGARARDLKLGLGPPQPNQIWRLTVPAGEPSAVARDPQYLAEKPVMLGMP